ncbi:Isopropylmalate dehydrogenase-like domain-containing protein [Aspergillus californicus]
MSSKSSTRFNAPDRASHLMSPDTPSAGPDCSREGKRITADNAASLSGSDAVLFCDCGELAYRVEPEKGLLELREQLGVYANTRPVQFPSPQLAELSAYKAKVVEKLDIPCVRDLTVGVHYGRRQEGDSEGTAFDTTDYSRASIVRLVRWAGRYALRFRPPKPVHSGDKHNVMATSRLWRRTVSAVFAREFPSLELDHVLVDTAATVLSSAPTMLNGVILTEDTFGDILSDQVAGIVPSPQAMPCPRPSDGPSTPWG